MVTKKAVSFDTTISTAQAPAQEQTSTAGISVALSIPPTKAQVPVVTLHASRASFTAQVSAASEVPSLPVPQVLPAAARCILRESRVILDFIPSAIPWE